jgi:hypothetical protein
VNGFGAHSRLYNGRCTTNKAAVDCTAQTARLVGSLAVNQALDSHSRLQTLNTHMLS